MSKQPKKVLGAIERAQKQLDYNDLIQLAQLCQTMPTIDNAQYVWNRPIGLSALPVKKDAVVG